MSTVTGTRPPLRPDPPEPQPPRGVRGWDVETWAAAHARQVQRLDERLAEACGRPVEEVADDVHAGRLLTADEARAYGLADGTAAPRHGRAG
ncbi:ATP-dependent Clp protease proteolytic subunit [Modestobacter excelsi]|uniref:ATP-dependent Clp protease proteolytic subunit n=1 Tax=Modestobacter excelsi TaxID=2213161 RepID=UPI001C20D7D3|nr:ATP-dependent Clp protease proteolytic subunit [Modestobacter excelsi]